ncbi:calphotin-like [Pseudorasbora parva]|uniref:calphotin-like n=1 Tax=Pseudorasbora parva TaxID=51549 RepID=UPI00351E4AC7
MSIRILPPANLRETVARHRCLSALRQEGLGIGGFAQFFWTMAVGLDYNDAALKDIFNTCLDDPLPAWEMDSLRSLDFWGFSRYLCLRCHGGMPIPSESTCRKLSTLPRLSRHVHDPLLASTKRLRSRERKVVQSITPTTESSETALATPEPVKPTAIFSQATRLVAVTKSKSRSAILEPDLSTSVIQEPIKSTALAPRTIMAVPATSESPKSTSGFPVSAKVIPESGKSSVVPESIRSVPFTSESARPVSVTESMKVTAILPGLAELAADSTEAVKHTGSTRRKRKKKKACAKQPTILQSLAPAVSSPVKAFKPVTSQVMPSETISAIPVIFTEAVPEPAAESAVPEPAAESAVPEPAAESAVPEPAAESAVPEPAAESAVPEPAAESAVPEPAAESAVPEPAAESAVPEPAAESAVPKPAAESDVEYKLSCPRRWRKRRAYIGRSDALLGVPSPFFQEGLNQEAPAPKRSPVSAPSPVPDPVRASPSVPEPCFRGGRPRARFRGGRPRARFRGGRPRARFRGGRPRARFRGGRPKARFRGGLLEPASEEAAPVPASQAQETATESVPEPASAAQEGAPKSVPENASAAQTDLSESSPRSVPEAIEGISAVPKGTPELSPVAIPAATGHGSVSVPEAVYVSPELIPPTHTLPASLAMAPEFTPKSFPNQGLIPKTVSVPEVLESVAGAFTYSVISPESTKPSWKPRPVRPFPVSKGLPSQVPTPPFPPSVFSGYGFPKPAPPNPASKILPGSIPTRPSFPSVFPGQFGTSMFMPHLPPQLVSSGISMPGLDAWRRPLDGGYCQGSPLTALSILSLFSVSLFVLCLNTCLCLSLCLPCAPCVPPPCFLLPHPLV